MRPKLYSWTPAAADLVGYASNVTGNGPWTMSTTVSGDNLAHQVTIRNDTANSHSGKTLTVNGTDMNGFSQSESLAGPGVSATVTTTKYFKSVTTVSISAGIGADTFDIGWAQTSVSQAIPIDWRSPYAANINVDISGTINFTVNQAFLNVWTSYPTGVIPQGAFTSITALAGKTADTYGNPAVGATAVQFQVSTVTAGATVAMSLNQAQD